MAPQTVIGIDLPPGRLLAVVIARTPGGPAVRHTLARDLPEGADASTVATLLRQAIDEIGIGVRYAVLAIPPGRGFVRRADEEAPPASEEYAVASWTAKSQESLQAVANRQDVQWLRQIAAQASLKTRAVTLRSLACLTAMELAHTHPDQTTLGVVLGRNTITLLALHEGRPLVAHSRRLQQEPGLDRYTCAAAAVGQMVHLVGTTLGEEPPSHLRVITDDADAQVAAALSDRLEMPVERHAPGQQAGLDLGPARNQAGQFAPAIGLALQGLAEEHAHETLGLPYLDLLPAQATSSHAPARRALLAAAGGLILLLLSAWGVIAMTRHLEVNRLRQAREERLESRRRHEAILDEWRTVRGWAAPPAGRRPQVSELISSLQRLLPNAAYVTRLSLSRQAAGPFLVHLEGRASSAAPLYEFVASIENSPLFANANLGAMSEEQGDGPYDRRFTLTFELQQ